MKPVESYSAINTRMDRPALNEAAAQKVEMTKGSEKAAKSPAITTASKLAAEKAPFDDQKVSEIKQKISSGSYQVDIDALAKKMLDVGVIGVDSNK